MPRLPLAKHPRTGVDPLECNAVMPSSSPLAPGKDQGPPRPERSWDCLANRARALSREIQLGTRSEPSKER